MHQGRRFRPFPALARAFPRLSQGKLYYSIRTSSRFIWPLSRYFEVRVAPTGRKIDDFAQGSTPFPAFAFLFLGDGLPALEGFSRGGESEHPPQRKARHVEGVEGQPQPPGKSRRGTKGATRRQVTPLINTSYYSKVSLVAPATT